MISESFSDLFPHRAYSFLFIYEIGSAAWVTAHITYIFPFSRLPVVFSHSPPDTVHPAYCYRLLWSLISYKLDLVGICRHSEGTQTESVLHVVQKLDSYLTFLLFAGGGGIFCLFTYLFFFSWLKISYYLSIRNDGLSVKLIILLCL